MVDPPTSLGSFSSASSPISQRQKNGRHEQHEGDVSDDHAAPVELASTAAAWDLGLGGAAAVEHSP